MKKNPRNRVGRPRLYAHPVKMSAFALTASHLQLLSAYRRRSGTTSNSAAVRALIEAEHARFLETQTAET